MTDLQTMVETSLYDDYSFSGSMSGESSQNSPSESGSGGPKRPTAISLTNSNIKELKKSLTLDFGSPESAKKSLGTPDIIRQFLQLASPELAEKIFTQGATVTTPTPTNLLFPKTVTADQEQYARGFIDALNQIHSLNNFSPGANLLSPAGIAATLAANTAAVAQAQAAAAASSSKAGTPSTAQEPVVTSTTTDSTTHGIPSPTNPGTSLPSVIMSTVGFPVSMSSLNSYHNILSGGLPGTSVGSLPAAMAFFGLQQNGRDQKPINNGPILADDRPPSQSADPGSMEFTNLTQALPVAPQTVTTATGAGAPFQLQANQYLDPTTTSGAVHMPQKTTTRLVQSGTAILVKREADQAVPNVSLQIDGPFGAPQSTSSSLPLDLKEQEAMKLERKRHRNRLAATRCRKRKLEKISDLEDELKLQEAEKKRLVQDSMDLKNEISKLRADIEVHRNSGCALSPKTINGLIN